MRHIQQDLRGNAANDGKSHKTGKGQHDDAADALAQRRATRELSADADRQDAEEEGEKPKTSTAAMALSSRSPNTSVATMMATLKKMPKTM